MPRHDPDRSREGADLGVHARLRAAFALSPTILCVTGLDDGRIREVNEAFLRATGYTRDEIIGRGVLELGLWIDPAQREQGLTRLRAGQPLRDVEARFRAKNGEERICILAADVVAVDGEACIVTALTDITDRTRAEAALRESERRFMLFFHANPLPMTIVRLRDGRHLEVNDAAVRHSGYSREEMLGHTKPELGVGLSPEQRERMLQLLHQDGGVRDFEATFVTRSGERRDLLVNSEVITFAGEPAVLSVSVDITERKQLEAESRSRRDEAEALAQALHASNRAKDEFLAMLGHELRNPLGTITHAVAVLDKVGQDPTIRHVTQVIGRQTSHLTRLVEDLLDVARVTSGKIALKIDTVDLHELAGRSVDALIHAGRVDGYRVALEGHPVQVQGDPARLEQVVNNLLDNALKYTPPGGSITIVTERSGSDAVLRVRDTGKGIRADLLGHIFDVFVQEPQSLDRSRGGLGLGLALVKRLVELHGGAVSASSAGLGAGSEFMVRLPALPEPLPPRRARQRHARSSTQRRVLIVEDSADARESLRMLLELAGHVVDVSEDGPSGLAKLRSFRPDIALVDLGLPGIDGYTLARMARQAPETREIRLVAVTGYGQVQDQRRAKAAGFDRHVTKPVDPDVLQEILAALS